jgi:glycerophosphoryl diester phosphodiesterase
MQLIAHRGATARAPENTLRAVERAAPHVDAVEVDVRRCGSGEVVVVHDASLERLTGAPGVVSELSLTELRSRSVLGSDQRVPRLVDVVDALPERVGLNVELKERGLAADVQAAVAGHPTVWVSSFDDRALAETTLPRALLFEDDWQERLDAAADLDCTAVHPQYELVLDDTERVTLAHDAGFAVNVWTPPLRVVPRLREAGVDGVIVDDWAVDGVNPSLG